MTEGLLITRRRLPHWRLEYSTYFITWCLDKPMVRLNDSERESVVESIMHFHLKRYHIWAYVVMDDHAHVLMTPMDYPLSKVVQTWKSFSARMINQQRQRSGRLWLPEYYDRIIRSENDFVEKLEYILSNPVRRWPGVIEYKWAHWTKDEFSYMTGK